MGCDGGTIPRRDELVRTKKKPEQKDKTAETTAKWKHCAMTQEKLQVPIVSCELGKLYNKEAVLKFLLNRDTGNETVKHIRNLKDVVELQLTTYNGFKEKGADLGDAYVDHQASQFICPVIGLEMNGKHRFVYSRKCGCVVSEKALKQVKAEACHRCGKAYTDDDIIVINGTDEEVEVFREKMEARRQLAKEAKKAKKRKGESTEGLASDGDKKKTTKTIVKSEPSPSTSSKDSSNCAQKHLILGLPERAKPDFSIAKDPNASEALKSIFTSHKTAKERPSAHWVTYNPLYY